MTEQSKATTTDNEAPAEQPAKVLSPAAQRALAEAAERRARAEAEAKEAAKETFWNRPIPKILEEEFKAMKAPGEANATAPAGGADETATEKKGK